MQKRFRKSIRIFGELVTERFHTKAAASAWYKEMSAKKVFWKHNLKAPRSDVPTLFDYSKKWIKARMVNYPMATWDSDERRLRIYVLPELGDYPIDKITPKKIKSFLISARKKGPDGKLVPISRATRKRIQSVLSSIFKSALNEENALIEFNPATGLVFEESRKAVTPRPIILDDKDKILEFLDNAKGLGDLPFVAAAIYLMSGLRKSEGIACKWEQAKFIQEVMIVSHIIEQASMTRRERTKQGEGSWREVGLSEELLAILKWWKAKTKFNEPDDFILCDKKGEFIHPRRVNRWFEKLYKTTGVRLSPHRQRHTFGSQFAANSGNIRALQRILGHSTIKTTEIYAELSGKQAQKHKDVVRYSNKEK